MDAHDQWQALAIIIDETEKALPSGMRGEKPIRSLLRQLRRHGDDQQRREAHDRDGLRRLLEAATQDLAWIERAAYQRAWGALTVQTALDRFDAWADQVLAPARRQLTPGLMALTCLNHTTALRHLPYSNMAIMSVPYPCAASAAGWTTDLLEAPRVIGRFLYRQGQLTSEPRRASPARFIAELSEWSLHWLEAVFGEVYAALVAGPAAGLYCQDQALAAPRHRWNWDDGVNVPPVLAPKIHLRVLQWLDLDGWAASLSDRWTRRLGQSGAPRTLRLNAAVREIFLVHPRDELMTMVDFALDLLQTCVPGPDDGWRACYGGQPPYAPDELEQLYADWARPLTPLPGREIAPAAGTAWWPAPHASASDAARLGPVQIGP